VNFVDIDLFFDSFRVVNPEFMRIFNYSVYVSRAFNKNDIAEYSWILPDPLPVVPIPLMPPDDDIGLNLATAYKTAYECGRYRRVLD